MPRFPGGTIALNKYLVENMKYPIYIDSNNKKEKIFLKFVVESDGSLNYVTILKGLNKQFEDEALRVVKAMPKWVPARQSFRNVACYSLLAIAFK